MLHASRTPKRHPAATPTCPLRYLRNKTLNPNLLLKPGIGCIYYCICVFISKYGQSIAILE